MKLWIKLTILLTIIINIVLEIGLLMLRPKIESFSVNLIGDKLKSIAVSIAASIDGELFNRVDIYDSTAVFNPHYNQIQKTIETTKDNLELTDDRFPISILDNNSIAFGVVLKKVPFGRDSLQQLTEVGRKAALKVYEGKICLYTDLYEDRYGKWLSGLAPIFDSERNVVGIIKVDQLSSSIEEIISEINNEILNGRILLIPATLILSFILAKLFLRPIGKVKSTLLKIADGNYNENNVAKSGGEVGELVRASETLRQTIFEQQQKIFNTIRELEEAKDRAEKSDRMKSEFLAVLSHEIRTPLNVILSNLEVIKYELDETEDGEINNMISSVKRGSDRLIRTVEMIVLYSELSSGSYNKNCKIVNAHDILCLLGDNFKNYSYRESIKLDFNCSANTAQIKADTLLFEETVKQVLDNALKFTEQGTVSMKLINKEESICIIVEDTGIGISAEFIPALFKPFRQENMTTTRPYDGVGLGLAIAKKCCDYNGFDLKIESEKNKGTKVEIKIGKEYLFN